MTYHLSSITFLSHFSLVSIFATECGRSARPTSCRRVPPHHSGGGVGPASVWGQGSAPISRWTRCGKSWRFAAVTRGGESPSRAPCHRRAVHPRTTRTLRWSHPATLAALLHSSLFLLTLSPAPSSTRTLPRAVLSFSLHNNPFFVKPPVTDISLYIPRRYYPTRNHQIIEITNDHLWSGS